MESDFKEYPKTLAQDDFWGQVKRTVHGKPVSKEQIGMIVESIENGLELSTRDILLDIGCGNGALSHLLFDRLGSFQGIDFSDYLISIAKQHFETAPDFCFRVADATDYLSAETQPERFTKALCYGCFSYFDEQKAFQVLATLHSKFSGISSILIGNLPDKARAAQFYQENIPSHGELENHESKIGIWRTQEEFAELAGRAGWQCHFLQMPETFYAAHYRYDVLLKRSTE